MSIHIGQKIREVFNTSGFTVTEFARRIKTTRQNVYGIFERNTVDTGLLERIGEALNHNFFQHFIASDKDGKDSNLIKKPQMVLQIEVGEENREAVLRLALGENSPELIKKALK